MELRAEKADVTSVSTPALVVNLYAGVEKPGGATGSVDEALGGQITRLIADGEITGRRGEITVLHTADRLPAERIVVAGLGARASFDLEAVRTVTGGVARWMASHGIEVFHTVLHGGGSSAKDSPTTAELAQSMGEAAIMATYKFDRYQTVQPGQEPDTAGQRDTTDLVAMTIVNADGRKKAPAGRALDRGARIAAAVNYTRDLGNTPPNDMTPAALANAARKLADEHGMTCEVFDKKALAKHRMGAILGVGQGSSHEPRMIVLRYDGGREGARPFVIVGKAITFDTGGISIKPSAKMEDMKFDKMGGCAVLGIMRAVASLGLKINVVGVVPSAENMPDGRAYRPGDILEAYGGHTIEIINTDAEGRLVLADALTWASEQSPREIIDLATLTGACVVALGGAASGAFGDESIVARLKASGARTGDRVWPLPLYDEYGDQMKSKVADIKNAGGRWGGACTAAAFLKYFVGQGIPWVHLDIAGTAWVDKTRGYHPVGATGSGVRLVVDYLAGRR